MKRKRIAKVTPLAFQAGDAVTLNETGAQMYVSRVNGYNTLDLSLKPGGFVWLPRVDPRTVSPARHA